MKDNNIQIQKWDSNYKIIGTQQLSGSPIKMFSFSNGMLVVSMLKGKLDRRKCFINQSKFIQY